MHANSLQSCPALCDRRDCSPLGFSIRGILQARIMEALPYPPPGVLPNPGIKLVSLCSLPWQAGSLPLVPPENPLGCNVQHDKYN